MANSAATAVRKRTAVLVVHGIGSQRALETVRGVIRAVWFDNDDRTQGHKRIWTHPEESGTDIDLAVMTTSKVSEAANRSVDFHELYWAHLMSETRGVAVLLWLFELGRKGPRFKPGMNGLWWGVAVFLCLMLLSIALLTLKAIVWSTGLENEPYAVLIVLVLMLLVGAVITAGSALLLGWKLRLAFWAAVVALLIVLAVGVILGALKWFGLLEGWALTGRNAQTLKVLANIALPLLVAGLAAKILMGWWGIRAFIITCVASFVFFCAYLGMVVWKWIPGPPGTFMELFAKGWADGNIPWSLTSIWSLVAAWIILAVYLMVNASFLQPYLGDAARYFRNSPANVAVRREIRKQAVEMLNSLHKSGAYDRIVVVAHSLGSAVAYDMLRAYYSSIHKDLPDPKFFDPEFSEVDDGPDNGPFDPILRAKGRKIIAAMSDAVAKTEQERVAKVGATSPTETKPLSTWLVTDFVTVGAALTHAYYLMCPGKDTDELKAVFDERAREREYPTSPPRRLDQDGLLAFTHWQTRQRAFHHGGQFAMTRWTNIYFPMKQLFWGDAIGGPVASVFGRNILDVEVSTDSSGRVNFFTHTAYWDVTKWAEKRAAPHIVVLRKAIDLEDTGSANGAESFNEIQGACVRSS